MSTDLTKGAPEKLRLTLRTTRADFEQSTKALGNELLVESVEALPVEAGGPGRAHMVEAVAIVVAMTLAAVAKDIVTHLLRGSEQGVQIDLRTKPATISYVAKVPAGFVVIIDQSGNPQIQQGKYESGADLEKLLSAVLPK